MKRQSIINLCAAVAIALLFAWIAKNTYWEEITIPAFPRGEAARNPFYAAERVLEELGGTSEWRRTLGELPDESAVLVLGHWHWGLIERRRVRLEQWVESGGRLVLVGVLSGGEDALEAWSGLAQEYPERDSGDREGTEAVEDAGGADTAAEDGSSEPDPGTELPPPVRDGDGQCLPTLRIVAGRSQSNPSRVDYNICGVLPGWLISAREPEWSLAWVEAPARSYEGEAGLHAVRVPAGRGSVTWIHVNLFNNARLLNQLLFSGPDSRGFLGEDNAVLFVDAVELHRGDHVVFASEEQSAPLLELAWTYGAPVVVLSLVLAGLALWRNAARFGPLAASPDPSRRSLAEQIRGTAQFALRVGGGEGLHAAMVRALHEAARLRIPGYERMKHQERVAAIARITGVDADELSAEMHAIRHPHGRDLKPAVALIDVARRNLSTTTREKYRQ